LKQVIDLHELISKIIGPSKEDVQISSCCMN